MPFIDTKTNITVSKEKEVLLKTRLGEAIQIFPGKSENWLMIAIEGDIPMYFRGENEAPMAYIEVKVFGSISGSSTQKMTEELTKIYGEVLGIASDKLYISYFSVKDWGWNGANF
ncbi:phenylpyruvate tautomerase MIF-related protein [Butyrivibrio sp. NC3005]|jgi:hypothetical protein|uniref:phenylpyruvate tautomerase MIF-related protein n=1 Tax=Butyrivibrio sp. NC3005 TaxID=1280685 RepID=UPI000417634C|nr:phenylpyruvate tautomerase MIF-related protein [Butyrivibrio sp. NC3005]